MKIFEHCGHVRIVFCDRCSALHSREQQIVFSSDGGTLKLFKQTGHVFSILAICML